MTIYSIAIHEAGHAVLSVMLGLGCKHVTVMPDGSTLGHSQPQWTEAEFELQQFTESFCLRQATVSYAGAYAVKQWRPESDWEAGAATDFRDVAFALNLVAVNGDIAAVKGLDIYARCRAVALVEHYWPEIRLVARDLRKKKTLTGDEVRTIISDSTLSRKASILSW